MTTAAGELGKVKAGVRKRNYFWRVSRCFEQQSLVAYTCDSIAESYLPVRSLYHLVF